MRRRSWWVGCTVLVAACGGGGDGKDGANGADGLNALVATTAIGPGADCVAGGYEVRAGQDLDGDGKLSAGETRSVDYVCNGAGVELGSGGADSGGADSGGADGNGLDSAGVDSGGAVNGLPGSNGLTSLVSVTTIAPGDECAAGGLKLEAGLDRDGSGALDPSEVTTSRALCNGEPGSSGAKGDTGRGSLIVTHPEDPGSNCPAGGSRIDAGQDENGDGALSADEIATTSYVCHGIDGKDGANGKDGVSSLVVVADEPPGANCAYGGQVITSGLDDGLPAGTAGDGVLDPAEVNPAATTYLCRPQPSLEDLLSPPGQAVSLHLQGGAISADFAVIEHLGSENAVVTTAGKTVDVHTAGALTLPATVLHGRFTGKPLDDLLNWRNQVELGKNPRTNMILTATDLTTNNKIASWALTNAWPSGLEVKQLAGSGNPEVTLEVVFEDLARNNLTVAQTKNAVRLETSGMATTCSSVVGIGSESAVTMTTTKGAIAPGALSYDDPVCARPLDGDFDLMNWRQAVVDGKASLRTMKITLSDSSTFDFTNAWPSALYVDTGANGQLVETVSLVDDSYDADGSAKQ